ncbi:MULTISPECIES: hypothetical protein [unclassified Duganella]|uniref:hypothetical protein n=1 Tax=unclassified Duganella TaxID=2636909 RepID=UPI000E3415F5|nr:MULTISPECIES: hypothetical protein [unclassified Duganella]RFP19198.1 hypothetical protein D0T23_05315 [Duganella sp. BJB475]RFP32410.1 hypothetical protein D0T21_09400 [Duganella sp. BJB476]
MDKDSFELVRLIIELVVGLLVTPFALVLWWMLRKLVADVATLERAGQERHAMQEQRLAEYKLHAAENFSTKNDLGAAMSQVSRSIDAVFGKLERIEDKLDGKADKAHS